MFIPNLSAPRVLQTYRIDSDVVRLPAAEGRCVGDLVEADPRDADADVRAGRLVPVDLMRVAEGSHLRVV